MNHLSSLGSSSPGRRIRAIPPRRVRPAPPHLPLLGAARASFGSIALADTCLLACQHILSSTHSLLRALVADGLERRNIAVIGKCYSTSAAAYAEMRADGLRVCPSSLELDPRRSFDEQFRASVDAFTRAALAAFEQRRPRRILVLDDGGELIAAVCEQVSDRSRLAAVEQTTSGWQKLRQRELDFPVVNVARSSAKLVHESPLIAESVAEQVEQVLARVAPGARRVLVLGAGAVGDAVRLRLAGAHAVKRFDLDPARSDFDAARLAEALAQAEVVIGCTGGCSLPRELHSRLRPGCVLISASSSDREFDAPALRAAAPVTHLHEDLCVDGVHLVNLGFPINFQGERDPIAPAKIQLTRALLYGGVLQAAATPSAAARGFVDLDGALQARVVRDFTRTLADERAA